MIIMEKTIKQIEPLAKSQERIYFEDGSKVRRCYGLHNPHYYEDKAGKLKPINISHLEKKTTGVGQSYLRSQNVVSVGFRKDDNPKKYLGLRPDFNQKEGNEQLEFSIEKIEFDSKEIPIDLNKNKVINPVTVDLGNVLLVSNRQRTRQIVKVDSNISDFKIVYRMHLKGLKVKYREDLDEYWIYSASNEFRFRIVKPSILDVETHQPIFSEAGENFRGLVKHSLIKQKDGTYFYVKEPTKEFIDAKLSAPYLIDGDVYYCTTADGFVYKSANNWPGAHDAETGNGAYPAEQDDRAWVQRSGNIYYVYRTFLYFDTSGTSDPSAVDLKYYVITLYGGSPHVMAMKGTQADTLVAVDFDSFSGSFYGSKYNNVLGWNTISFNPQGISDINTSGTTKICQREDPHDYDDIAPGVATYGIEFRSANYTGTTYDPYLEITESVMKINIGDVWKEVDSAQINIGDVWKDIVKMQVNIGDSWKTIYTKYANYFKVKIRARGAEGGGVPVYKVTVGVRDGAVVIGTDLITLTESVATYTSAALGDGSYTIANLTDLRVSVYRESASTGLTIVTEIEVDIYDSSDNLLATVKPNGDFSVTWNTTEATHYGAVNSGISTPTDNTYINTLEVETDVLDTVNPSW